MPTQGRAPNSVFKVVMLAGAATTSVLFGWTVWMIVHFDANPASVRLGVWTVVKVATAVLPGPVLLAFLAWHRSWRAARVLGWVAVVPAVALPAVMAYFATTVLRPALSPGAYDDAAREAEVAALALVNADGPARAEFAAVRALWEQRPASREAMAGMARRLRTAAEEMRAAGAGFAALHSAVKAPFAARGVSGARAAQFDSLYTARVSTEAFQSGCDEAAAAYERFAQRLDLLVAHHGTWRWEENGTIAFDDPRVERAHAALAEKGPTPAEGR
ncbi:MAG: hypothetical protein Q8L55_15995 [Phycisphaerales bacterium]|nr:hypothetical protein [Phycisphaerales bacterium]